MKGHQLIQVKPTK